MNIRQSTNITSSRGRPDSDTHQQLRMAKQHEAKFSVEFDYDTIVKNEVDRVQQFKDTVKLLEDNKLMQGLAHQIHLCFRSYVKSDINGYVNNFGKNEVIKDNVTTMLKIFSGHMMTILGKLVDGMSTTYLKYLFQNKKNHKESEHQNNLDDFEKLANQWSMHQLSPRTLNMSITSIQSAISKEIMHDPIDQTTKDLKIPSGFKKNYQKVISSPKERKELNYEECPKTEKMYDRIEFMKQAGKTKINTLEFPPETTTHTNFSSTSRLSQGKPSKRMIKKLPKSNCSRRQSKDSARSKGSNKRDDVPGNMQAVSRCISTRALNKVSTSSKNDVSDPYNSQRCTSRNTGIMSLKASTTHTQSKLLNFKPNFIGMDSYTSKDNSTMGSQGIIDRRAMAGTPCLENHILDSHLVQPKRSGSGDKPNSKKLEQWVNFKLAGNVKGKGRNKVKLGFSTTSNMSKGSTLELKKKNIFKAMNLRASPTYENQEPIKRLRTKKSQRNGMKLANSKLKPLQKIVNPNL